MSKGRHRRRWRELACREHLVYAFFVSRRRERQGMPQG